MRIYIYIVILILISCQEYKKQKNDDRYIVFNLYIGKNLTSHSITLDFKDKSVFVHNIINEANFDRFVEDEVEVVEGTLPKEAIKQKNDRIDYNTIYELGFIADNKMTTDTNVLFEKIDSILQNGAPFSCKNLPKPVDLNTTKGIAGLPFAKVMFSFISFRVWSKAASSSFPSMA